MSGSEMHIIRELCKALDVPFLEKKTWPTKEVEEDIRNDAVALGIIKEEDKYKRPAAMLQREMNNSITTFRIKDKPDDFFAPAYKVMLDWTEFNGERIGEKWFSEYYAAKTYLEIKHGRYGDIEYVKF